MSQKTRRIEFVASAYVVDLGSREFLLVLHKKLGRWMAPGGHIRENELPHDAAARELREEVGKKGRIEFIQFNQSFYKGLEDTRGFAKMPLPAALVFYKIPKQGAELLHYHLDFIYVIQHDSNEKLKIRLTEILDYRWIRFNQIENLRTYANTKAVIRRIAHMLEWEV